MLILAYTQVRAHVVVKVLKHPIDTRRKKVRIRSTQEQGPEKCASMIIMCVREKRELKDMCRNGSTIEG